MSTCTSIVFCVVSTLALATLLDGVNAQLDNRQSLVANDDAIRALYAYMLSSEPRQSFDYDGGFRRDSRSGKPTFIRFGKRTPGLVANTEAE